MKKENVCPCPCPCLLEGSSSRNSLFTDRITAALMVPFHRIITKKVITNCVLQLLAHRVWVNSLKLCAELLAHNCVVTDKLGNKPHCAQLCYRYAAWFSWLFCVIELNQKWKDPHSTINFFCLWSNRHASLFFIIMCLKPYNVFI